MSDKMYDGISKNDVVIKRWKLWSAILLIFVAGIITGTAGTAIVVKRTAISAFREDSSFITKLVMKRLSRKLDLSDNQKESVYKIVLDTSHRLRALRKEYRPEAEAIINEGMEKIRGELDQNQKNKLDEIYSRLKRRLLR